MKIDMDSLKAKLFIEGVIQLKTGLHIGGSSTALDIGGIDNNVIKTADGVPYIPGSSLKGKLRTLYALGKGYERIEDEDENMKRVFGIDADKTETRTRLVVRDAFLDEEDFKNNDEFSELELDYTEGKWENTINRLKSSATPRQMERVPAGAQFNCRLVYNIFDQKDIANLNDIVIPALRYLQDDYLGGSGSRGYGQIEFQNMSVAYKTVNDYKGDNVKKSIESSLVIEGDNTPLIKELTNQILSNNG